METEGDELLTVSEHFDFVVIAPFVGVLAGLHLAERLVDPEKKQCLRGVPDADRCLTEQHFDVVDDLLDDLLVTDIQVDGHRVFGQDADAVVTHAVVQPFGEQ